MARTVTALFDSRADAETARGRLVAAVKTQSTRIIAKDTAAAVDSLTIDAKILALAMSTFHPLRTSVGLLASSTAVRRIDVFRHTPLAHLVHLSGRVNVRR